MSTPSSIDAAFSANVAALSDVLQVAAATAEEAAARANGNRIAAAFVLADLDRLLADATALHRAAMALHDRAHMREFIAIDRRGRRTRHAFTTEGEAQTKAEALRQQGMTIVPLYWSETLKRYVTVPD